MSRLRKYFMILAVMLALVGTAAPVEAAPQAAIFAAAASVSPQVQYLNDTAGTVFTFTIHNTGTTSTIGAVEINRPSNQWTIIACPLAPTGWSVQRSDDKCRYRSLNWANDDIKVGTSNSQFQVKATTLPGNADRTGTWKVIVSRSNQFDNPSLLAAAAAEPPGLNITAYAWQILDAIVDGSPSTAGGACPTATAANHSAITGSSGHTIVLCGKNRMNVAGTPLAARSSLSGTFIASVGSFSSGVIAANTASSVVLGKWSNVSITSTSGTGKTIITKTGSALNQNSPLTTLTSYEAKNQPPVAVNDSYSTNEDTPLTVAAPGVLGNDSDPDGDPITAVVATNPTHGTLTLNTNGSFTYTPSANYNGSDSFTYKAKDSFGAQSTAATVTITINPVNDAPVAVNDSYSTNEDTQLNVPAAGILGNDTDVDGDTLSAVLVSGPAHGTLILNANGSFGYTPDANYNGSDSFTYKANDGALNSNVATVNITVNAVDDAPVAVNDSTTVTEDASATSIDVLSNDTDIDGGPKSIASVTQPANGIVVITGGGTGLTYQPNANYCGSDSFTYTLTPGSSSATVSITVNCVNDAPVAVDDGPLTTNEDTPLSPVTPVLANDTDVDNTQAQLSAVLVSGTSHGTVVLNASGLFTYTPNANYNGTDSFTYKANDGSLDSNVATVSIIVTAVNDAPGFNLPASPNQSVVQDSGAQTVAGFATNISAGPSDESSQVLTFHVSNNNTLLFSAQPAIDVATGDLTYTPAAGQTGSATVSVYLTDDGGTANGGNDTSGIKTFTISINPPNFAPVAATQGVSTNEDTAKLITLSATDADGDPTTFSIVLAQGPTHGTLGAISSVSCDGNTPNTCTTTVTYTPNANYNGSDSFKYTANDGKVDSTPATVSITVNPVNDAPVAVTDSYSTNEDTALNVPASGVLGNDTDVDNDTLTATLVSGPSHAASFTLNTDGSFSYAPNANYNGSDSFTYKANDGTVDSNVATVNITVNSVNDVPVASGQSVSTNEDTAKVITLSATDADQDALTFGLGTAAHGALVAGGSPACAGGTCTLSVTYTPDANYNGSDSFTFKVNDGTADSNTATVNITVVSVNDAPSFTKGIDQTVLEDSSAQTVTGWATNISAGPADESSQTLTFTVTNDNNALFSVQPSVALNGDLTYTPAADAFGSATVTVNLQDDGGTANGGIDTSTQTLVIVITGVNDAPTFTKGGDQTVDEDAGAQTVAGWATGISAGPNESGQTVSFIIDSNDNPSLFSAGPVVASNGTMTYTPAANQNGVANITLHAKDNGGTANGGVDSSATQSFVITVNAVNDPPVAQTKTASAQANMKVVGINPGLLTGVTDADSGVNGCNPTFSVASITANTGGTVSNVNLAAGTFDFEPNAGFTGAAVVNYTVQDNGCPGTATSAAAAINITVSGPVIWFVNPAAATNGDGRLSNPFNTLASAAAVDASGDRIFVYSGTATGGISLNSNEWLIGQGVTGSGITPFDTFFSITPPAGTITRPTLSGTRPTIQGNVAVATNDAVRGLNIQPNSGTAGLSGSGATGLTVGEVSVTTSNAAAVNLSSSGGTLSFTSISANGGSNGIVLNSTTGSFTVTGNGGTCTSANTAGCTGGTIQNMTGADDSSATPVGTGIVLNNAANVSLTRMFIHDHSNYAIRGTSVTGFTFDTSVINGTNGTDAPSSAGSPYNEGSIKFDNLAGSATISNTAISGAVSNNVRIDNTSATVNRVTFTNDVIGCNSTNNGEDGILLESENSGVVKATVQNTTFTCARGDLFNFVDNATSGAADDLIFNNNTLSNNHPAIATGGGGTTISSNGTKDFTFHMESNSFLNAVGHAVLLVKSTGTASYSGTFTGNTIGTAATANSGSLEGDGLKIQNAGQGTVTVAVTNNQIRQYNNFGIELETGGGATAQSGNFNATITGNVISNPGNNPNVAIPMNGIQLNAGTVPGDTYSVCTQLGGAGALANTINGSGANGGTDVRLRQRQSTTVRLPGYGGANNDNTAVQNFLIANNITGITALASNTVPTGGGFVSGSACATPGT